MKRSISKTSYSYPVGAQPHKPHSKVKNKTTSTVLHHESWNQQANQNTTKKNSLNKASSCVKIPAYNIKSSSKSSLLKNDMRNHDAGAKALAEDNKKLREEFCRLQELHLKDKAKIQLLIGRISEIKLHESNNKTRPQTPSPSASRKNTTCKDFKCIQKRKKLQSQLYRQRLAVQQLANEKQTWQHSRLQLKTQYLDLLQEIGRLKTNK